MDLAQLPSDCRIFVDANIIALHMVGRDELADACTAFLLRIKRDRILAFTSVIVAAEVIHRVMIGEVVEELGIEPRQAVQHLKKHPDVVKTLKKHADVPSKIYQMGISIEPVSHLELHRSKTIRANYGLLTNDSLVVAMMQKLRLVHLATNDSDFERVQGIKVWNP